jgi:MFS family permease
MSVELPRILHPLRRREYRYLAGGTLISLFGDGVFLVALPLQVYELSNVPTAMALVGGVWTVSQLGMLLVGGWASDRFERRRLMVAADLVRAVALAVLGVLSLTGGIRLWHFALLGAVVGASNAFFNPSATSIVPDLLAEEDLARANAFLGVARPAMVRLLGPAAGGLLVGLAGPGPAFLLDAATFVLSALLLMRIPLSRAQAVDDPGLASSLRSVREGLSFVRRQRWCWVWLLSGALGLIAFTGPADMLLPYVVKNDLGLAQREAAVFLGTVLAAGGLGSVLMAVLVGIRGLPRQTMTAMYGAQALGVAALAGYGVMTRLWHAVLAALLLNAMFTFTDIAWTTALQREVPRRLLGRVSSLDWLMSIGMMPVSFALVGGLALQFGARNVLVVGGGLAAAGILGLMLVPGAREPDRRQAMDVLDPLPELDPR